LLTDFGPRLGRAVDNQANPYNDDADAAASRMSLHGSIGFSRQTYGFEQRARQGRVMTMADAKDAKPDYSADVKKYVSAVDEPAVAGIVKHLGIALRGRDSSLVASTDPDEMKRVRDHFLKKKLALTESDEHLDAAVKEITGRMKGVHDKSRVTVYYLLAEKFGKLAMFHPKK